MDDTPDSIQKWIEKFLAQICNANTAVSYRSELKKFAPWVESHMGSNLIEAVARMGYDEIEEYVAYRSAAVGEAAVAKAHGCLSSFFRFLGNEGMIRQNPWKLLEAVQAERRVYLVPSKERIRKRLERIQAPRDRAIHHLYYEGLTPSEVVALDVSSIGWDSATLVRPSDGQKLPLGPWAVDSLKAWREERAALLGRMGYPLDCTPALFIGSRMKGIMNPKHQARLCVRSLDRISDDCVRAWTPRLIRIACGVHMLEAGASARIVAVQLGVQLGAIEHFEKMAKRGRYAIQGAQEGRRPNSSSQSA